MAVEGVELAVEPSFPYRTKRRLRDLIDKVSWTFGPHLMSSHCVELGLDGTGTKANELSMFEFAKGVETTGSEPQQVLDEQPTIGTVVGLSSNRIDVLDDALAYLPQLRIRLRMLADRASRGSQLPVQHLQLVLVFKGFVHRMYVAVVWNTKDVLLYPVLTADGYLAHPVKLYWLIVSCALSMWTVVMPKSVAVVHAIEVPSTAE